MLALQWLQRDGARNLLKAGVQRRPVNWASGAEALRLIARPRRSNWCGALRCLSSEPLRIFNSLTNKLEPFLAVDGGGNETTAIRWYNCGPTVYDSAHLGHARTYVCLDIIRRVLTRHFQLDVLYALGLTDIDDKIIKRAAETSPPVSPLALARRFEVEFFEDLARLGVAPPDVLLRVTEHVPDIIDYVAELQRKGFAYVNDADHSVYFDVAAFNSAEGHRRVVFVFVLRAGSASRDICVVACLWPHCHPQCIITSAAWMFCTFAVRARTAGRVIDGCVRACRYGKMGPATAGALRAPDDADLPNANEGDEGGLDRRQKRDPRDFVLWKARSCWLLWGGGGGGRRYVQCKANRPELGRAAGAGGPFW